MEVVWKILTVLFLGYSVGCTYLAHLMFKDLNAVKDYEVAVGYVLKMDDNVWMLVRGVDLEEGSVVDLRIDKR